MADQEPATVAGGDGEAVRMQILQLECVIAAKDREIQLLRDRLSTDHEVGLAAVVGPRRGSCSSLPAWRGARGLVARTRAFERARRGAAAAQHATWPRTY